MYFDTPDIDEYADIIRLWKDAGIPYKPEGRDTKDNVSEELHNQPEYWIGAYEGREIVGIIVGTDDGRKGWINRLAVDENYRGEGLGRRLVERLESIFEEKGFKIWATLIEPDNPEGMKFFEKIGFEDSDIKYYSKREDEKV